MRMSSESEWLGKDMVQPDRGWATGTCTLVLPVPNHGILRVGPLVKAI